MEVIKEYQLNSGLTLKLFDKTYRYFGEYFFIEIEVICEIPSSILDINKLPEDLISLVPEKLTFKKTLSKKGVYETQLEDEKKFLLDSFEKNSLPYLNSESFPYKFYEKELKNIKRKKEIEELRRKLSVGENSSSI